MENPQRTLLVYQLADGSAAGQVRIDLEEGGGCELSWTMAPSSRGKGIGKRMVVLAASLAPRPARAEIKDYNEASKALAAACGMKMLRRAEDGLEYWGEANSEEECRQWLLQNPPKS